VLVKYTPSCLMCFDKDGRTVRYTDCGRGDAKAGQITQPQSCAFLHGVDWKRPTLERRCLSATRRWPTPNGTALTSWTSLGLRKAGQFYYPLRSSCVTPGTSLCDPLSW
ncbi:hypothetical protein AVEN_147770-1, partial [Araneus ventricosus]